MSRPSSVTDPNNHSTVFSLDALGRPWTVIDATGYITTTTYDAAGRLQTVTDANNNQTNYNYYADGSLNSTQDALGLFTTYLRDPAGNVTQTYDPNGNVIKYAYDALNRLTTTTYAGGGSVVSSFDAAGRLTTFTDSLGVTTFGYDPGGRLVSEFPSAPLSRQTYSYDPAGNTLSASDASGVVSTYAYDTSSRLSSMTNVRHANERSSFNYDWLGQEAQRTLPNGMVISHLYDNAGRELVRSAIVGTTTVALYTSTYDAGGRMLSQIELGGTSVTYAYDAADRLTLESHAGASALLTTYAYDPAGNRQSRTDNGATTDYVINPGNRLFLVHDPTNGPQTYTYDKNGNVITIDRPGGGSVSYIWDAENRLTGTVGSPTQYTYNGAGQRQQINLAALGGGATNNVLPLRSGPNVTQALPAAGGAALAQFMQHPDAIGGLTSTNTPTVSSHFIEDIHGHVRKIVSASGAVTDSYLFSAFGEILAKSGTTQNPFGYHGGAGYQTDDSTRLHIRARNYDVTTGRWLSPDPSGQAGGTNLYEYAGSDPVNMFDPDGEFALPFYIRHPITAMKHSRRLHQFGGSVKRAFTPSSDDYIGDYIDRELLFGRVSNAAEVSVQYETGHTTMLRVIVADGEAAGSIVWLAVDTATGTVEGVALAKGGTALAKRGIQRLAGVRNIEGTSMKEAILLALNAGHSHSAIRSKLIAKMGLTAAEASELTLKAHHVYIPNAQWGKRIPIFIKNRPFNYKIVTDAEHYGIDSAIKRNLSQPQPYHIGKRIIRALPTSHIYGFGRGYARTLHAGALYNYHEGRNGR